MTSMSTWLQAGNPGKNHTPWKKESKGTWTKMQLRRATNNAAGNLLERATELSNREYTPYEGERVAGLSQNEDLAKNLAFDNAASGKVQSYYDKAEGQIDASTQDYNAENLAKYTNPYTKNVVDIGIREANKDFENQRSDLRSNLAASDAFGSDRGALLESELSKNHEQNVGDITVRGMSDAYDRGQQAFFADSDRRTRAAQAYQSVGNDVTQMNTSQLRDLLATGGLDRLLNQAQLDVNYADFIEERDWDINNLQPMMEAIATAKGVQSPSGAKKSGGTWSTVLGAAGTIIGAYFGAPQVGGAIGSAAGGAIDG
jgi:hypothetical protein